LFEGAQGTFLDLDHGTYPYVTSSNTTAGGACTGTGVPPHRMDRVVGVMKAYTTRVGEGPLPTEDGGVTQMLHSMGREFGATTGRARRCGWFDAVVVRYASRINGLTDVAVTKLDVLDSFPEVPVCTGYRIDGEPVPYPPAREDLWARIEPVYEELPGWQQDTSGARAYDDLPPKARHYVERIAELLGAPVGLIGVGPWREQLIVVEGLKV
jgi:adenylosuccinate synthase